MFSRMGNCLKSKQNLAKNDVKISVVGLDDSGKTTIVKVLKGDSNIKDLSPTVGFEPHDLKIGTNSIQMYDLGGGERVREIWKHYLAESYGFIFSIDCSDRSRILECSKVFSSFVSNEKVCAKPILIIGNKQDLPNSMDESEIVQYLNVEELVNRFQIPCRIELTIANSGVGNKTDESLNAGFEWLLKYIMFKYDELKTRIQYDVDLQKTRENMIKKEKFERVKQRREMENLPDDLDDFDKNIGNPWKPITDLKLKDPKIKTITDSKLSAYDKQQALEEMRGVSPMPGKSQDKSRLTTIDEEKLKFKNKFMRNNKLAPYDEKLNNEVVSKNGNKSWAITDDIPFETKKTGVPNSRRRFED